MFISIFILFEKTYDLFLKETVFGDVFAFIRLFFRRPWSVSSRDLNLVHFQTTEVPSDMIEGYDGQWAVESNVAKNRPIDLLNSNRYFKQI